MQIFKVERLTPKFEQAEYASFKVGVPSAIADKVIKPEFWPSNVFVNRFYFKKVHVNKVNFQLDRENQKKK